MDDIFRLRPVQKLKGLVLRSLCFKKFSHPPENSHVQLQHIPTKLHTVLQWCCKIYTGLFNNRTEQHLQAHFTVSSEYYFR